MAWITPKTDWSDTTPFTYADYNRIRNNLLYINDKINTDYPSKSQPLDLGDAKTGYNDSYYPSEFNAFEDALESFTRIGQDVNIGTRSYYSANGDFISFSDLNRIESCCLRWYTMNPPIESISITPNPFSVRIGSTQQLQVVIVPSDASATVTWESSDNSIATVDSNGLVTGIVGGEVSIIATVKQARKTTVSVATGRVTDGIECPTAPKNGLFVYDNKLYVFDEYNRMGVWDGNTWITSETLPSPVVSMVMGASVEYNDNFYLIGGVGGGQRFNNNYVSSDNGITWSESVPLKTKTYGGCAIEYDGNMYYIGGTYTPKNFYRFDNTKWTNMGLLPFSFTYGGAVIYNNELHILGGHNSKNHYKWNGSVWNEVSTLPTEADYVNRIHTTYCVYDNKIHAFQEFKHYSWDGTEWTQEENIPYAIEGDYSSAVVYNDKIYLLINNNASREEYDYTFMYEVTDQE